MGNIVRLSSLTLLIVVALQGYADEVRPEDVVKGYIRDYYDWNASAYEALRNKTPDYLDIADRKYQEIIQRYCPPGHESEPVAFGTNSSHDPDKERILDVKVDGDLAIVSTRHEWVFAGTNHLNDYEYHLKRSEGRWYLTSVLYIVDGEKYEGL